MRIDELGHVRTGDKGDDLMIAVFAWDRRSYAELASRLTAEDVAAHYGLPPESVSLHAMPSIQALTFHLRGILQGGVTGNTHLDGHGKTMGYHLLSLELPVSETTWQRRMTDG